MDLKLNGEIIFEHLADSLIEPDRTVGSDVPPYSVALGNPARVIRQRMSAKDIEALLAIRWWEWPLDRIKASISLLCSQHTDRFIEFANSTGTSDTPNQ